MAAGVPVCATPTELNRELLGGAAAFADEGDTEGFVATVSDCFENEARRAVMSAAGRHRATDFSPGEAARSYADLYADIARQRARL